MRNGVFRAVAVAMVVALAQIAEVVKQRGERADGVELGAECLVGCAQAALVAVHQPRHRQRHVEHVLDVVVLGLARPVRRIGTLVEAHRVAKGALERLGIGTGKELAEEAYDFSTYFPGIGGPDRARNVVAVAAHCRGFSRFEYRDTMPPSGMTFSTGDRPPSDRRGKGAN